MSRLFTLISLIVFFISIFIFAGGYYLVTWSNHQHDSGVELVEMDLEKGMTLEALSKDLEKKNLVSSARTFSIWVKIFSNFREFQAGHYAFQQFVSPLEIERSLKSGKIFSVPAIELVIPEGFTLKQMISRCVSLGIGTSSEFYRLARNPEFLLSQGISSSSIEGYLYPATYSFYSVPSEAQVYTEMINAFWKKLPEGYEILVASRGITLHQAMIIASLVEAETSKDFERPMVAEVIWNRLERKIPLGIDASVIYGVPDFNGNLTRKDLDNKDNPYNLRIHLGLPPSPITTPHRESLLAVVNPASNGYLFYVLDPDRPGEHTFSRTIEEHNREVKKLISRGR